MALYSPCRHGTPCPSTYAAYRTIHEVTELKNITVVIDQLRIQFALLKKLALNINFITLFKYKPDNENHSHATSQIAKFWGKISEKKYIYIWMASI